MTHDDPRLRQAIREREERRRQEINRDALCAAEDALDDFAKAVRILSDEVYMKACYWPIGTTAWRFVWAALCGEGRGP